MHITYNATIRISGSDVKFDEHKVKLFIILDKEKSVQIWKIIFLSFVVGDKIILLPIEINTTHPTILVTLSIISQFTFNLKKI